MNDGLHVIPADEYHRIDRVSNSRLSWLARSPAFCRWNIDHPADPTPAMRLGSACHYAILEPEKVEATYAVAGRCEARTSKGAQCSNWGTVRRGDAWYCGIRGHAPPPEQDEAVDAREVLSRADMDRVLRIRDAVHANRAAAALLRRETRREVSMLWADAATQLPCKGRIDVLADDMVADVKVTRDAHPHRIESFVARGGVHRQGAMYLDGLDALGRTVTDFLVIAVEPEPPHETCVYLLDPHALRTGREHVRRLMETYAACERTSEWGGYPRGVNTISVPIWAQREMFPEEAV